MQIYETDVLSKWHPKVAKPEKNEKPSKVCA